MTAPIYNYTIHTNPAGGKDALTKLRTFLIAQGWRSEDYRTSVRWQYVSPGVYQWASGDDDFCQMFSNGYGHQSIRMRFRVEYDSGYTNHYKFHSSMLAPTDDGSIDYSNGNHPQQQGEWTLGYTRSLSVPSGTFNELYLFGNNKWCLIGFRCTATTFIQFNFGTPELYPEYRNTTELMMRFPGQVTEQSYYRWDGLDSGLYQGYFYPPWSHRTSSTHDFLYYGGDAQNYNGALLNMGFYNGTEYHYWNGFPNVRQVNSWSGKRLMMRPDMFVKNASLTWEPIGHHPAWALPVSGLALGEVISYGNDDYMTFPAPVYGLENGFGIRVG